MDYDVVTKLPKKVLGYLIDASSRYSVYDLRRTLDDMRGGESLWVIMDLHPFYIPYNVEMGPAVIDKGPANRRT